MHEMTTHETIPSNLDVGQNGIGLKVMRHVDEVPLPPHVRIVISLTPGGIDQLLDDLRFLRTSVEHGLAAETMLPLYKDGETPKVLVLQVP